MKYEKSERALNSNMAVTETRLEVVEMVLIESGKVVPIFKK